MTVHVLYDYQDVRKTFTSLSSIGQLVFVRDRRCVIFKVATKSTSRNKLTSLLIFVIGRFIPEFYTYFLVYWSLLS
jgi:hypothetical protein